MIASLRTYDTTDSSRGYEFRVCVVLPDQRTSTGEVSQPQGLGSIPVSHEKPAISNEKHVELTPQYVYCIFSLLKRLRHPICTFCFDLENIERLRRFKRRMFTARTSLTLQQTSSSLFPDNNPLKRKAWLNVQTYPSPFTDSAGSTI